jgi:hypothetical protein
MKRSPAKPYRCAMGKPEEMKRSPSLKALQHCGQAAPHRTSAILQPQSLITSKRRSKTSLCHIDRRSRHRGNPPVLCINELLLAPLGSSWLLLAPPCSSWLFLAPLGSCWLLLASLGSSWLLLAPLGSSWLQDSLDFLEEPDNKK